MSPSVGLVGRRLCYSLITSESIVQLTSLGLPSEACMQGGSLHKGPERESAEVRTL